MGHVIGVIPASGGVGATTIAAVLAVRAAETGQPVVAVDLDRFGGRLDVVLGVEQEPGWRWDRLRRVAGVVDGAGLARELPRAGAAAVLAGPSRLVEAQRSGAEGGPMDWRRVLPDVLSGLAAAHGVTVLDLPRDTTTLEAVAPLVDAWVTIVGTSVPQLASAAASVPLLRRLVDAACARSTGAVMRRPCEPWLVLRGGRIEDDVADAVCDHLDAPVVGRLRDDLRLVSDVTSGIAPGSRGRGAAVEVADQLLLRLVSRPPLDLAATGDRGSAGPAPSPGSGGSGQGGGAGGSGRGGGAGGSGPGGGAGSSGQGGGAGGCPPGEGSVDAWRWSA